MTHNRTSRRILDAVGDRVFSRTAPQTLVERHFAGRNGPRADRRMWRLLARDEEARALYRRLSLAETLAAEEHDPDARARVRMARSLFPHPAAQRRRPRWLWWASLLPLAAGLAVVLLWARIPSRPAFVARGPGADSQAISNGPHLTIFRLTGATGVNRVGHAIAPDDALAFGYVNPPRSGYAYLMVFAVDASDAVHWYWPAWQDPQARPSSIEIRETRLPVELGEAVRHHLAPGAMTLYGLFSAAPLDVKEVEAALARGDGLAELDGHLWREVVEVQP